MRKRWLIRGLLVVAVLVVALCCAVLFYTPSSSFPVAPTPNGYVALTRAAAKLPRPPEDLKELETEALATAVDGQRAALAELRNALQSPGVVTMQMSESWFDVHMPELMNLKAAARFLDAEAELNLRRGTTNEALKAILDGLRLGEAIQRGGVLIDFLTGTAAEVIAITRLPNAIAGLNASDCKQTAAELESHEERREPIEAVQRREKEWSWRTYGVVRRLQILIQTRVLRTVPDYSDLVPDTVKEYNARTRKVRRILLDVATRAYTLERGKAPTKADELVPDYLKNVPVDPETGQAMAF